MFVYMKNLQAMTSYMLILGAFNYYIWYLLQFIYGLQSGLAIYLDHAFCIKSL